MNTSSIIARLAGLAIIASLVISHSAGAASLLGIAGLPMPTPPATPEPTNSIAPTFAPNGGLCPTNVTITSAGNMVYWTTNGNTPTTNLTGYASGYEVTITTTNAPLKALAWTNDGYRLPSTVASATFTNAPAALDGNPWFANNWTNYDAIGSAAMTNSVTVTGDRPMLLAFTSTQLAAKTNVTVTFGVQSFTEIARTNVFVTTSNAFIQAWKLDSPTPGTANVVATWNGNANEKAMQIILVTNGVVTGTPAMCFFNAGTAKVGITNVVATTGLNDIVIDGVFCDKGTNVVSGSYTNVGSGQVYNTSHLTAIAAPTTILTSSKPRDGDSTTMLWWGSDGVGHRWSAILVPVSKP